MEIKFFRAIICLECGKSFCFQNYLQKHIARVHGPKRLPHYKCRQCPERFDSDLMLHIHMQSHPKVITLRVVYKIHYINSKRICSLK